MNAINDISRALVLELELTYCMTDLDRDISAWLFKEATHSQEIKVVKLEGSR